MGEVLQRAAAAGAEMRARGLNPVGRRLQHLDHFAAFAAHARQHPLAGQREGHMRLALRRRPPSP